MAKLIIDARALVEAFDFIRDAPMRPFLDRETGRIVEATHPGDEEAAETFEDLTGVPAPVLEGPASRWEEIPSLESDDEYELMRRFAESVEDAGLRDRLLVALQGKGAFGRFKSVLATSPRVREAWFNEREHEIRALARAWLEACGLDFELRDREAPPA
jgi:hypothetical protein